MHATMIPLGRACVPEHLINQRTRRAAVHYRTENTATVDELTNNHRGGHRRRCRMQKGEHTHTHTHAYLHIPPQCRRTDSKIRKTNPIGRGRQKKRASVIAFCFVRECQTFTTVGRTGGRSRRAQRKRCVRGVCCVS